MRLRPTGPDGVASTSRKPTAALGEPRSRVAGSGGAGWVVREVCQYIAARLHHVNRVWLSQSGFVWEIAELIERIGATFQDGLDDSQVEADFGDGYRAGEMSPQRRRERLLELLSVDRA